MSTLKGTTMHPRCRHIGACWDLLEWFQFFSTSQNTSQIQFRTLKKKKNCLVPMLYYSWRPFYWCINYQCRTDIDEARVISALRQKSKFEFRTFLKKNPIFGFPWCSIREDHSIDALITNVGLILTKLRWFQLFVKSQNSNFELFWRKKSNFWVSMVQYSWRPFHWCINY